MKKRREKRKLGKGERGREKRGEGKVRKGVEEERGERGGRRIM